MVDVPTCAAQLFSTREVAFLPGEFRFDEPTVPSARSCALENLSQKVCAGRGLGAPTYERGPTGAAATIKEHAMTTAHTRTKRVTAAVSTAIATIAAPALLFLGAGIAQATPDISARGPAGIIADLPTPRSCGSCVGFNPQPDPPGDPDPDAKVGLGGPDTKVGVGTPGGAPSPSRTPGDTVGFVIYG